MRILHHSLRFGDSLNLIRLSPDSLHLLHARGRGIQVDAPAGWVSLWWPLHGRIGLTATGSEWTLPARHMQLWRDGALRCRALGPQAWLALAGPAALWDGSALAHEKDLPLLLPWRGSAGREVVGLFARLARGDHAGSNRPAGDPATLFPALWSALADRQHELQARLPRCNGRTLARRQQTLLRLLRVRHAIECNPDVRLDLECLAKAANYSPCHLIRIFRGVFDQTPSEYAARLREQQAWEMVSGTGLPICEITEMLGFESQSAFCRAFKNTFGQTTSEVRRSMQHDGQAVAA
ncbi:AraC family transcriptional regulator [Pseudoxanthomonas putridarboris]|uniref:AraC family transcriptional regulator n=1 Tax=Pseudoxanthomonas putridarboris TaxID=752605 RepID=A0ABU9J313_9GAMM